MSLDSQQDWPDGTSASYKYASEAAHIQSSTAHALGNHTWRHLLTEAVWDAFRETDPASLRAELWQVRNVTNAWLGALDRREVKP